ncbi:hypothetical protein [Wenyingzhuangia aestuarii]|uniref:hypothetical protein n=1 Tax=Wenyingzhuangia aestuarii TaxID=1647582 RepID=UPI00143BBCFA|nr:hypothetical protein [Wenyingzhuangia aestuarii]NJB83773.1 hypothetical protein [Wenyingzhuangia aestuarii]
MKYIIVIVMLCTQILSSQSFKIGRKVTLPKKLEETSGIIYIGKELVSFNDSGGKAELYVLNPYTGKRNRTVRIQNAQNVDWEAIAQDEKAIYIADTGNNYGDRTDLVIYKVLKKDFIRKNAVNAEKIYFSYEDQFFYERQKHYTNFDCEAITIYQNQLLLFTKNWGDYHTNIYKVPTKSGNYSAIKIHSLDIGALLTSVEYNHDNNLFAGTAYDKDYKSYLIIIKDFYLSRQKISKIDLTPKLDYANQIEAIAWKDNNEVYITREASKNKVKGKKYKNKQKLFLIKLKD